YAWRWLPWHLRQASRNEDLHKILWDPLWISAKLEATDVNALITDYELVSPSAEARLVQGALSLSANVLAAHPAQLVSQMVGRLLPQRNVPLIHQFVENLGLAAAAPWLRSTRPALHPPGTALVRTLEGHSESVTSVAVAPDGKRAVSASRDNTLKVWD